MRAAEFASSLCSTVGKHNGESSGISRPVSSRAGCTDSVLKLSEWRLRNMETLKKKIGSLIMQSWFSQTLVEAAVVTAQQEILLV